MKKNCWEYKNCGREPGGEKVREFGVCPASTEKLVNGMNAGKNGGRACWAITGTFCGGTIQGTFAQKLTNCSSCDFYKTVILEEAPNFAGVSEILKKIRSES